MSLDIQKKLFFLGTTSLGSIFAFNYVFRGDSNKELPELISEQEEIPTPDLPEPVETPEIKKAKLIQKLSSKAKKLRWTKSSDVHQGIKIGSLKGFLVEKNPSKAESIALGYGALLEQYLKQLPNKENYSFFKGQNNNAIDWKKLKSEIENGNYPFIG